MLFSVAVLMPGTAAMTGSIGLAAFPVLVALELTTPKLVGMAKKLSPLFPCKGVW